MMITQAAVAALRTWRRRFYAVALAIAVTLAWRCRGESTTPRPDAPRVLVAPAASVDAQLEELNARSRRAEDAGDFVQAISLGAQAYELAPQASAEPRSTTYINLGGMMLALGNLDAAKRLVDQAEASAPVTWRDHARVVELHGLVEQALGRPKIARGVLQRARAEATRPETRWAIYTNQLGLEIEAGDAEAARALVADRPTVPNDPGDRAAEAYYLGRLLILEGHDDAAAELMATTTHDQPSAWDPWLAGVQGRALLRGHHLDEAEQPLRRAARALEEMRAGLGNDAIKSCLLAKERGPFEDLAALYLTQGRVRDALEVVQRATGRSMLDGLLSRDDASSLGASFAGELVRARVIDVFTHAQRASRAVDVPPIDVVLARLRGHHVVTYFRVLDRLWAIAVRADGTLVAHELGDATAIGLGADAWIGALGHPLHDMLGEALGLTLLPDDVMPAGPDEPIYLVPDSPLRNVPFAALRRHGTYVVQHNPVAYGISLASLAAPVAPSGHGPAMVLGDPLSNLPEARVEVMLLAALLRVPLHVGPNATGARIIEAADAALLHIAAHTERGQIQLADGYFSAADVLALYRVPALVTLLGCSSAHRQDRDELDSLAVAFLAAGAHAVVAALWSLDDHHGRLVAQALYDEHGARDPVTALARAQRQMIASGSRESEWSTFVVFGGLNP